MRVNVCYSAELEELPSIVQNLSTEVANNLRAIADSLDNGVSETLANGQTRNPDDLAKVDRALRVARAAFLNLDTRIQDIQLINSGAADVFANPEQYEAEIARRQAEARAAQEQALQEQAQDSVEPAAVEVEEIEESEES